MENINHVNKICFKIFRIIIIFKTNLKYYKDKLKNKIIKLIVI
jgi:hypothetical protein